jgi:hypothetical protein
MIDPHRPLVAVSGESFRTHEDPGIVQENVDPPTVLRQFVDERPYRREGRQIQDHRRDRLIRLGLDLISDNPAHSGIPGRQHNVCAPTGELGRGREADTGVASGDHHGAVLDTP